MEDKILLTLSFGLPHYQPKMQHYEDQLNHLPFCILLLFLSYHKLLTEFHRNQIESHLSYSRVMYHITLKLITIE